MSTPAHNSHCGTPAFSALDKHHSLLASGLASHQSSINHSSSQSPKVVMSSPSPEPEPEPASFADSSAAISTPSTTGYAVTSIACATKSIGRNIFLSDFGSKVRFYTGLVGAGEPLIIGAIFAGRGIVTKKADRAEAIVIPAAPGRISRDIPGVERHRHKCLISYAFLMDSLYQGKMLKVDDYRCYFS